MKMEETQQKIQNKISSIKDIVKASYVRPENKNEEHTKRLFENQNALIYLVRDRGLDLDTVKHFKLGLNEKGNLTMPIFKNSQLIDYKSRTIPPKEKGFFRSPNSETWLFNADEGLSEARKKGGVIVCEGEIDAITLWQHGFKNVVSLIGGAQNIGPWIQEFDNIPAVYINLDSDEVGQRAARGLAERIGMQKCINVKLPVKDANDFFKKYDANQFRNVIINSKKFSIEDVSTLGDFIDEIKRTKDEEKDFKFGYPKLDKLTGGFNRKNLIVLSAYSSHGKTHLAYNLCINSCLQGKPILYIPLEDNPKYAAKRMLNIFSKQDVATFPDYMWDALKKDVVKFPLYMYTGQDKLNLEIFKKIIEVGKRIYNIEIFILDHIHFLAKRSGNMTEEIGFLVRELIEICRSYDVALISIAHIRKRQNEKGKQFNIQTMPNMDDLKDSSSIYQDAHMVLMALQKDATELDPNTNKVILEKTFIELEVQKNREGMTSFSGKPLRFDFNKHIGTIEECTDEEETN